MKAMTASLKNKIFTISEDLNFVNIVDGFPKEILLFPMPSNRYKALSKTKFSLFSKGTKFIPTSWHFSKAKIKKELKIFGRKLMSLWHFCNKGEESTFNLFKNKSKFNSKEKRFPLKFI